MPGRQPARFRMRCTSPLRRQGLLGVGFPERLGGHTEDADPYYRVIFAEEMHRLGSGVVFADLATHWIGLPPVVQFGSEELLETVARPVLAGKRRIAFAVTEPSGGSDAGALRTRAERRDDHWLVNGSKTLISGRHCARTASWPPCARAAPALVAFHCCSSTPPARASSDALYRACAGTTRALARWSSATCACRSTG